MMVCMICLYICLIEKTTNNSISHKSVVLETKLFLKESVWLTTKNILYALTEVKVMSKITKRQLVQGNSRLTPPQRHSWLAPQVFCDLLSLNATLRHC